MAEFAFPRKSITNAYGVPVRISKCGLAHVVKLSKEEFLPILEGEVLPRYYRWDDAVRALEAALAGETLPKARQPLGDSDSPFEVLGLRENAGFPEVKKAFRKLQLTYHPDHGGDRDFFTKIQEAYETIQAQA